MPAPARRTAQGFLWIFILVGMVAMGFGVSILYRSGQTNHWPVTDGVILASATRFHSGDHGGGTYSAEISYHYQVNGADYTGRRWAIGSLSSSSAYAQGIVDRYPAGKKVPVYYSPANPQLAVLETGVHGGAWVCFAVGTVFVLAGVMFLQLLKTPTAAVDAPAMSTGSTQQPPVLMGVIFILMGSFAFFMQPAAGVPSLIGYGAGGMFVFAGIALLLGRLENKIYAKLFGAMAALTLLAIFNWISFAPGERIGTVSTPFSQTSGANVKLPFAIITSLFDLCLIAILIGKMTRRRKN